MRIVFIGCVEFSYHTLDYILTLKGIELAGVVTRRESAFNADFRSLEPLAVKAGVPCYFADGSSQDRISEWLKELVPDVIYCFGWSFLLGENILEIPRLGVIGYHPAALPKNRGRHPIIWALALGLTETASTFFFMDEGADSGDILSQELLPININDDAASLYAKCLASALRQIGKFSYQLAAGSYQRITQDHEKANVWRRRTKEDGKIDWRMSSTAIYNLVRALTKPYVGAHFFFEDREFKVWKAEIVDASFPDSQHLEPGKVLCIDSGNIVVKCGNGALKLTEHEMNAAILRKGQYL
ncbi:MAG: formyltransferase family protein [Syntrophaceae bacterium]